MVSSFWRAWSPSRLSLRIGFYCVLLGPLKHKLSLLPKSWDSSSKNTNFVSLQATTALKDFPWELGFIGFYWDLSSENLVFWLKIGTAQAKSMVSSNRLAECVHMHGKYDPRWFVLNLSISHWKVTYVLIGIVPIRVWFLGGLGTSMDDMSSTCQYHNGKLRILLLQFSAYTYEFLVDLVWTVFP